MRCTMKFNLPSVPVEVWPFHATSFRRFAMAAFSFAAYNAGPRKIAKARRHAKRMRLNQNRWFGHVEIAAARTISREPVTYVRNIFKYHVTYKHLEKARAARASTSAKVKTGVP